MNDAAKSSAITIVGGGATGVILTAHLLKSADPNLRVTLVERRAAFGQGQAYSTTLPQHLLNVSDQGMSALAEDPGHFHQWVSSRGLTKGDKPYFAPRSVYAEYLQDLLSELAKREPVRLRLVHEQVSAVRPTESGVEVALENGTSLIGRAAVLATGNRDEPAATYPYAVRLSDLTAATTPTSGNVLVLGTGLSMVDAYLQLHASGFKGQVVGVSRRGLLPSPHKSARPVRLDSADIPLGTDLSYFVRWFRDFIAETESRGGDWRDAIDGLRPYNQRIWQSWPASAKRRFLEHTKAWWDIHRHRMAPEIHEQITKAIRAKKLRLIAGRVAGVADAGSGKIVAVEHRRSKQSEKIDASLIIDCTGILNNVSQTNESVLRSLIDAGQARPDPLHIGLDVTADCALIDKDGKASSRLFAAGPITRGTFFEIDAVPEIRAQAAKLARFLTG
ncbi:MAG: FAD/NAD(P)-binding protein [Mesorhizobium sp.]